MKDTLKVRQEESQPLILQRQLLAGVAMVAVGYGAHCWLLVMLPLQSILGQRGRCAAWKIWRGSRESLYAYILARVLSEATTLQVVLHIAFLAWCAHGPTQRIAFFSTSKQYLQSSTFNAFVRSKSINVTECRKPPNNESVLTVYR